MQPPSRGWVRVILVVLLVVVAPVAGWVGLSGALASDVSAATGADGSGSTDVGSTGAGSTATGADGAATEQLSGGTGDGSTVGVDLGDAGTTVVGANGEDYAGWSVAGVGDVNGDGVDDVLVGAPENDTAAEEGGAAYLFYGPVERGDLVASRADVTLAGPEANDTAAWSVAGGDLNGDQYSDIVVGVPAKGGGTGDGGGAYVVYGGPDLPESGELDELANVTLAGEEVGADAGYSVAVVNDTVDGSANATGIVTVGDDGDGGDDEGDEGDDAGTDPTDANDSAGGSVVVGAPFADTSVGPDAGAAYVFDLSNGSEGVFALDEANRTFVGASEDDIAGWSVAAAGDVTNDSEADLLIGAPGVDVTEPDTGAAYVVSDVLSPETDGGTTNLSNATARLAGVAEDDYAGVAVGGGSDLTGDGVDDVIVGAPYVNQDSEPDVGAAYVVAGNASLGDLTLSEANLTAYGARRGDLAGSSVAAVNVSGNASNASDEPADLLVGAPQHNTRIGKDTGAAYLVDGEREGTVSLKDADVRLRGEGALDRAGSAVAAAGDVGGDEAGDVIVGAPYNDSGGRNAGAAYILFGQAPDGEPEEPSGEETETPTETATPTVTPEGDEPDDDDGETDPGLAECEGRALFDVDRRVTVDDKVGSDFDVDVTGNAGGVTVENDEGYSLDVYVRAESRTSGGVFGPFSVPANGEVTIDAGDTDERRITAVGIVCSGARTPKFGPFTLPDTPTEPPTEVPPPSASLSVNDSQPRVDETVLFDASASTSEEEIVRYRWDVDGDGEIDERTTEPTLETTYDEVGEYDASVTVVTESGRTGTASVGLTVLPAPPSASLSVNDSEPRVNETVAFDASASTSDEEIVGYRWDVDGDGTVDVTTAEPTLETAYDEPGEYDASVTVVTESNLTDTASVTVTVRPVPPSASLSINDSEPRVNETVLLNASESSDDGVIVRYRWDVDGDGEADAITTEPTLETTYVEAGEYEPTVTVVDDDGATDSDSETVVVSEAETETATTTETETTTTTETETETATATETETSTATETETETETETATATETETETATATETAAETPTEVPAEATTEAATVTATDAPTETEVGVETEARTESPADPETATEVVREARTETATETSEATGTEPGTETATPAGSSTSVRTGSSETSETQGGSEPWDGFGTLLTPETPMETESSSEVEYPDDESETSDDEDDEDGSSEA